ncbi:SixA phosphatase family protein [Planktotalea sp.]|uniref:SixA phosphatase family protein n=1 Tax=Planktotalea sp. TaxID=2029877 RepID=UPI003D6C42C5
MRKTLIVMRHAKSSWDIPGSDIERPLNARGHSSAKALGDWLRSKSLAPDEVFCSAATRAQETGAGLKLSIPLSSIRTLYMAPSDNLLSQMQGASGDTVLVIAHNPGIGDFAQRLAKTAPDHPRFSDYPTGATTVFRCEIENWAELKFGAAIVSDFVIPREL